MPFLSGPVTFLRYRLAGPRTSTFGEEHTAALEAKRGRGPSAGAAVTADGIATGWTGGRHIFDTKFELEKNVYPEWLLFDLQTQTDRLPPDRLRSYYETDLEALAKDNPSGFASARQKREAKQAARSRLEEEAKDGRYRKWACVPCAWDGPAGTVFFGATSQTQADRFSELFKTTFPEQVGPNGLEAVTAASLAVEINPAAANEHLSPFVPGVTPEDGPSWCADSRVPQFLGNEFLLWLWYFAETEGDTVKAPDGNDITFMFRGGIKLDDPRGVNGNATINSDAGVRLPESRAAARAGKLPRKAAFTLVRHGEEYSGVVHAETLAVSSARLPQAEADGDQRGRDEQRLQHVRDLAEAIDQLFAAFLARRLSEFWQGDVRDIGRWLTRERAAA